MYDVCKCMMSTCNSICHSVCECLLWFMMQQWKWNFKLNYRDCMQTRSTDWKKSLILKRPHETHSVSSLRDKRTFRKNWTTFSYIFQNCLMNIITFFYFVKLFCFAPIGILNGSCFSQCRRCCCCCCKRLTKLFSLR